MDKHIYQSIIEDSPLGYVYYRISQDNHGKIRKYETIKTNTAYEEIKGLEQVNWLEFLSNIIKSKNLTHQYKFEDKHYRVNVSFPQQDSVILCFIDVTTEVVEKDKLKLLCQDITLHIWYLESPTTYGFVNQHHADFLGVKREDIAYKNLYEFYKPEEAKRCIEVNKKIFQEKKKIITKEWIYNSKNERRLLKVSKSPKFNSKDQVESLMCIAEDITDQYNSGVEKKTKERILYSMILFTQELLTNEDSTNALSNGIAMLGNATRVDRVYYWENHYDDKINRWVTSQRFEWCLDGVQEQINNPDLQNIPLERVGDFMDTLSRNKPFMTHIKDMDGSKTNTKQLLQEQGILSILVLPIFVNKEFKGYIGFDSCGVEKEWSQVEISLLESFVLLYKKAVERDILEQEIHQVQVNFDNFFNKVHDLLFVIDFDGNLLYVNDTVVKRLGYSRKELLGKSVLMLHSQQQRKQSGKKMIDIILGKETYSQIPIITKDGEMVPVETYFLKGVWDDNPVLFSVSKDISLLRMSEEKFSKAFNNSGVSMFITTYDEEDFIEVNDTFLKLTGYERHEVLGKNIVALNISVKTDIEEVIKKEIMLKDKCSNMEIEIKCKDGSIRTGLCNIVPLTINNKKCLLSNIIDITERKLIMQQLAKAKEESDIANNAKSNFLSHVSHEIRTPMNAVIGYSDLLSMTELNPKQQEYISGVKASSTMLLSIINDILDWEKIDNNELELDCVAFKISETISSVVEQVRFRSISQHVEIVVEEEDVPSIVYGDALHLQQVLLNLVSNAMKFTSDGSIIIGVRTVKQEEGVVTLEFRVEDTGLGIPQEKIKYIFSAFKQVNNKMSSQYGGTGLGLPICKEIVTLMDGDIWVESVVGKGSTFFFTASFHTLHGSLKYEDAACNTYYKEKIPENMNQLSRTRVLVVDDNEINQDVLKEILETKNMIVTVAHSGFQAIEYVKAKEFDIVLMDIRMPEMDGYQASAEIRKFKNPKELPIIAVTASASPDERGKCMAMGIDDCIIKPIDKLKLFQAMLDSVGSQNNPRDITNSQDELEDQINDQKSVELLNDLYGIDTEAVLNTFGGNEAFVINILKKFNLKHKNTAEEIRQALLAEKFELAERIAHTVKGLSGQIAARGIYQLSAQIEAELKKGNISIEKPLVQLESELENIFKHPIFDHKPEKESLTVSKTINLSRVQPLLAEIEELLLESDMDVADYLEELKSVTVQTSVYEDVLKMQEYGDRYDFDNALKVLESINMMVGKEE